MHDGKALAIAKFLNLNDDFRVPGKTLRSSYQIAPIFAEETESSKKANVSRDSSGVLYQCRKSHKKTANGFGVSRASVSAMIKRVLYAITTFSGPKPMDLRATEKKVK